MHNSCMTNAVQNLRRYPRLNRSLSLGLRSLSIWQSALFNKRGAASGLDMTAALISLSGRMEA